MSANSGKNMSKATDSGLSSKLISFSHPFGHQNVLNKKPDKSKGHVLAAAVSPYNSKRKIIRKYPNKEKSCPGEPSNLNFHSSLTPSQNDVKSPVNLQCVNSLQIPQEIYYSYKDPKDSNNILITKTIESGMAIKQPTIGFSQNNTQKSHNFSIDSILQSGNNSFKINNISHCTDEKILALNQLNEEFPSNLEVPSLLKSNVKNTRPIITVRKDLKSPVNSSHVNKEYCNIQTLSNVRQSNVESIVQPMKKNELTPSISNQDAIIVHMSNSNTLTKTTPTPPVIRAPLESINNIKSPITLQNLKSIPLSSNTNLQINKKDELSLECYTCKKVIFDNLGNSKSLIYDHLIFGRASCKTCSKTVSCSGFTKMRNSNSGCCKTDQLVYANNPVHYLIGELDNCEKNPCYYLAEYMMKIKVLWIYMPWCQAVVDIKQFVKNPYKIPPIMFKGWDKSKSSKEIAPLIKQENSPARREHINDKKQKLRIINKENEYPSMKRSLTDEVNEHTNNCTTPPAKKIKSTLRTFRIKQEFIDNCESQVNESPEICKTTQIDCPDSMNNVTCINKTMMEGKIKSRHKQHNPNYKQKNEKHSKSDNSVDNFAPIIVDVCSVQDRENNFELDTAKISNIKTKNNDINGVYYSSQFNENLNIDNDLELSCGSTIMTPDASPQSSPVDSTKLSTEKIVAKNNVALNHTNLTSLRGRICVSKYIKDVAKNHSNTLVSEKTIEECPMCYQKLSLLKMTVNTESMVLKFVCSCNLHIHILPNKNGKLLWPFNEYDYKKNERNQKMRKRRVNKRTLNYFFLN